MTRDPFRPFELDPDALKPLPPEPEDTPEADDPDAEGDAALTVDEGRGRRGRVGWLIGLAGLGLIGLLLVQAVDYVGHLLATNPLLGWPFALFLVVVVASAVGAFAIEYLQARRLRARWQIRREAERLVQSELQGEADQVIEPLRRGLGRTAPARPGFERFDRARSTSLNDGEVLRQFEQTVLAPIDRRAYRLVLESSRDIGLLTALSPLGLLDGVLVLWRTTMMLRQISALYGMRLGPAATLGLLRRCVRNAALAGLADVVSHATVEHVGAGIAALLSARAGQGAGNALLAGRLGLEAIRQIRPLPFTAEPPPRLSHLRRAILETAPDRGR